MIVDAASGVTAGEITISGRGPYGIAQKVGMENCERECEGKYPVLYWFVGKNYKCYSLNYEECSKKRKECLEDCDSEWGSWPF